MEQIHYLVQIMFKEGCKYVTLYPRDIGFASRRFKQFRKDLVMRFEVYVADVDSSKVVLEVRAIGQFRGYCSSDKFAIPGTRTELDRESLTENRLRGVLNELQTKTRREYKGRVTLTPSPTSFRFQAAKTALTPGPLSSWSC